MASIFVKNWFFSSGSSRFICLLNPHRAVEKGCKKLSFTKKIISLKSQNIRFFSFFSKNLKIQIVDSESQQKIRCVVFLAML